MTTAVQCRVKSRRMPLPFDDDALSPNQLLAKYHYLGPINRGQVFLVDRNGRKRVSFEEPPTPADTESKEKA